MYTFTFKIWFRLNEKKMFIDLFFQRKCEITFC
jgi:hypothetical protein